ncbi:MAG TPA: penicillin-binding protein 2 [Thermomicrobiaceae bacterium]|nr:penicillin-binding protein 2 [Thermomicrobiaceae bacterium]
MRQPYRIPRRRINALLGSFVMFCLAIAYRIVTFQVVQSKTLTSEADAFRLQSDVIPAERGDILDARGRVLATNVPADRVSAIPAQVTDVQRTAQLLAPIIGRTASDLVAAITQPGKEWVVLQRQLPDQKAQQIKALKLPGIVLNAELRRTYPMGTLAAHVLGFVNDAYVGSYGVEGAYDKVIGGTPGKLVAQRDTSGNIIALANSVLQPPIDGSNLVLTIDSAVQRVVEQQLDAALAKHGAPSGTVVIQNAKTGAIIAMASRPTFDPNNYGQVSSPAVYNNTAIADVYEPGSTFKTLSMSVGLDTGTVTPNTVHNAGPYKALPGGGRIYNALHVDFGPESMMQILEHSSNLGMLWVVDQVGKDRYYPGIQAFGIGKPTGVDLPGEAAGILPLPNQPGWSIVTMETNAFGQGLAVTPLQLVNAASAIANGGRLMKPFVVQEIRGASGTRVKQPTVVRSPISATTSQEMTTMLVEAVAASQPYQQYVSVPGYDVAEKTGTAQIPAPTGGYLPTVTIASVIGWGPAEDPEYTMLVRVDRPQDTPWGESAAGPTFRAIFEQLFLLSAVAPTHPIPAASPTPTGG